MQNTVLISILALFLCVNFQSLEKVIWDHDEKITEWKAGVAKVNITPEESMWMAGYASRNRPSEGTLHDIWVKALAFEDANGKRAVLVTTDIIRFPKEMSDRIRDRVEDVYGLSRAQIILNSSHTHTGPEVDASRFQFRLDSDQLRRIEHYAEKLESQIFTAIDEAFQALEPARIYTENGVARFAVNRRNNQEATLYRQSELAGPSDHAVPVIKVEDMSGDLIAIAFGYACHPTVLNFYKWSGDYPGFAQLELEKAYPGVTALFFQGAGGDQNPLPRRSVELAEQYGRALAVAVQRVLEEDMRPLSASLSTAYSEVNLKFAEPSPTKEDLLAILDESSGYPDWQKHSAQVLHNQLERGESLITSYPYPVQVWHLGDQPVVALGGELLVDYAVQLKQIFGDHTFVLGYSNDVMGYLPSARVIVEGGYEGSRSPVFTTPWSSDIEVKIIHEVIKLAEQAGVPLFESSLIGN